MILVLITLVVYYQPISRTFNLQPIILILASFIFYAVNRPVLLLLLLSSIAINILVSYKIAASPDKYRKWITGLGVAANLSLLAFFKYSPLIGKTFFTPSDSIGEFLLTIPLPIGVSFFTFISITLLVDTFRETDGRGKGKLVASTMSGHIVNATLMISFFPQILAGPIVKAREFIPQIQPKRMETIDIEYCFKTLLLGYFFKMVLADNLKDLTFWIAFPYFQAQSGITLLFLLFGYSLQLFADFAGYSLIAIGVAALFGYKLPQNFNYPYISKSFSEFWTRWHMSLSGFLKEYLYFPLGGNRKGNKRTYLNLMIVMVLGGFWHGAAWSYAVWGAFHGLLLVVERYLRQRFTLPDHPLIKALQIIVVFSLVTFAWLLFKLPDFRQAIDFIKAIFKNLGLPPNSHLMLHITLYALPLIFYHLFYLVRSRVSHTTVSRLDPILYGTLFFLILTNSGSPTDFIYFQF
ncbi:MAG: MBOAT family O-acyltransferase [Thermodesulfobacteriota bacterium]